MKIISLILLLSITIATTAQSDTKEKELSNAEVFSAQSGALIQKEFIDIGTVKRVAIRVVHYTDLISSEKISSVRFEYVVASSYSSDTKIASLDADEVDGLIKSLNIISEKVFPTTPTNYTEVTYRSRGGFEAGCFWSKNNWSVYLKLEKYDSKSFVSLKKEDLPEVLRFLEEAKVTTQ